MQFPTGGIVRDPLMPKAKWLIWCDSITDSIVWMREESVLYRIFLYATMPRIVEFGVFYVIGNSYHTKVYAHAETVENVASATLQRRENV